MNELKEIFLFIGLALKNFLSNFLFYGFYVLIILIIMMGFFLINYRFIYEIYPVALFFLVIITSNQLLKRKIFLKQQFGLNLMFVNFLDSYDRFSSEVTDTRFLKAKVEDNWKLILKKTRESLGRKKFRPISKKIVMAIATIEQVFPNVNLLDKEKINSIFKRTEKYFFIGLIVHGFLIIPFGVIAFFFTSGLALAVKFLVLLVGYLFVCFLSFTIVEPVMNLLILKKVFEKFK